MRDHLERALIMGVRQGPSASLARLIAREGMGGWDSPHGRRGNRSALVAETGAVTQRCGATVAAAVGTLFAAMQAVLGAPPDIVAFTASFRVRGPFVTLDANAIARSSLDRLRQDRRAWAREIELRPWVERF
jgi:hypothetical protein